MKHHTQADCCRLVASYLPLWFDEPETMGTAVYWSQRLHDRAAGPSYEVGSGEPIPPSYEELKAERDALKAQLASLRSQVAAKDADLEWERNQVKDWKAKAMKQKTALATAEARGFRAAAEWLGDPDLGSPVVNRGWNEARAALRAEADRREGE